MKKLNCELLLLLWVAIFAAGQASARDASAERSMLIALENAWNQAQMHRDGEALNRLIVDTFVYTDWDGSDATAETELARLTNGDHTRAAPAADEPGGDAAPEAL